MNLGPKGGAEIYKERRRKFMEKIKDGIAIISAHPEQIRNNDVHHKYRQDSCFYYLSGFVEPESVLVLNPSSPNPFTLFVREKNPARELWDGFRYGIEGTEKYFGANKVYPISEFETRLPEILKHAEKVYYKLGEEKDLDKILLNAMDTARRNRGRSGLGVPTIVDVKQIVGELRLFKSKDEIEILRKACEISAEGHLTAMRFCRPGVFEYEVEAEIEREFRRRGSERIGYGSIVGRGPNATVLHYVLNDDKCRAEDLILIDAGAEYGYMTGDITRTFPVNGKFTPAQRRLYEAVLRVQMDCIKMVKPGIKYSEIHTRAIDCLVDEMLALKLLSGNKKSIIDKKEFLKYYPHGTGHWLGMDVHDSGLYSISGESRKIEPGMCFTVEPGLYIPENDTLAPAEFRGLGIRIEDDLVVTSNGVDVLTSLAPKEVGQLEALIGSNI